MSEYIICEDCGRKYEYDRSKGHRKTICNSCVARKQRKKRKVELIDYAGGECKECGYSNCHGVLTFHHEKPNDKEFGVGKGISTKSMEDLKAEVDKCKLLCRNCHHELECREEH